MEPPYSNSNHEELPLLMKEQVWQVGSAVSFRNCRNCGWHEGPLHLHLEGPALG